VTYFVRTFNEFGTCNLMYMSSTVHNGWDSGLREANWRRGSNRSPRQQGKTYMCRDLVLGPPSILVLRSHPVSASNRHRERMLQRLTKDRYSRRQHFLNLLVGTDIVSTRWCVCGSLTSVPLTQNYQISASWLVWHTFSPFAELTKWRPLVVMVSIAWTKDVRAAKAPMIWTKRETEKNIFPSKIQTPKGPKSDRLW
jgi:hypothetical protein